MFYFLTGCSLSLVVMCVLDGTVVEFLFSAYQMLVG